jgi:hypothetical protein
VGCQFAKHDWGGRLDARVEMYIVVMSVSLLLSHTEKKQKNYFASSDPHQWEEEGHGILEGSWGFGCRGIGGWGEEEEEDEQRRADNQQSWISG